jgi:hypothetical protein
MIAWSGKKESAIGYELPDGMQFARESLIDLSRWRDLSPDGNGNFQRVLNRIARIQ